MSDQEKKEETTITPQPDPPEQGSELKEKDLDKAIGGLNPQPLPPDKLPT